MTLLFIPSVHPFCLNNQAREQHCVHRLADNCRVQNPQVERLRARLVEIDATEQANVEAIEEKAAPLRKLEEELHPMVAKAEYHRKREEGKVIRT